MGTRREGRKEERNGERLEREGGMKRISLILRITRKISKIHGKEIVPRRGKKTLWQFVKIKESPASSVI